MSSALLVKVERATFSGLAEQILFKVVPSLWELFVKYLRKESAKTCWIGVCLHGKRKDGSVSSDGTGCSFSFLRLWPLAGFVAKLSHHEKEIRKIQSVVAHFSAGFGTLRNRASVEKSACEAPRDHSQHMLTVGRYFAAFVACCITRHDSAMRCIPRHRPIDGMQSTDRFVSFLRERRPSIHRRATRLAIITSSSREGTRFVAADFCRYRLMYRRSDCRSAADAGRRLFVTAGDVVVRHSIYRRAARYSQRGISQQREKAPSATRQSLHRQETSHHTGAKY